MDKSQADFLHKRIHEVPQPTERRYRTDKQPEPVYVRNARKTIEEYEAQEEKKDYKRRQEFRAARLKVSEAVHAGNYEHALAAVHKFEATWTQE